MPSFSMGLSTYRVPASLHDDNRRRMARELSLRLSDADTTSKTTTNDGATTRRTVVYLEGGRSVDRYDTDHEPIFRQESYFHYLFGVKEPDCAGAVDVATGTCTLFVPRLPPEWATFMGRIKTLEEFRDAYGVDRASYTDEAEAFLKKCDRILVLKGRNSDSGNWYLPPQLPFLKENANVVVDDSTLFPVLCEARVVKSSAELDLLKHVTHVTSMAHVHAMRNIAPGMAEFQAESLFRHYCHFHHGHRLVSYTPICACGPNSATLHYGHAGAPNDFALRDGQMCLFDMGSEYHGYASDVTCSFPVNGVFTDDQTIVHNGVLDAQRDVLAMLRPGADWTRCHETAEAAILRALRRLGVVATPDDDDVDADTVVERLVELRLGAVFMPHGLGHFLGVDTHDVGGYLPGHPPRSPLPGLKSLRTARLARPGMVLTVEPGCYFVAHLIDEALANPVLSPWLNKERLEEMRDFGGIRLEDVVRVTENGCENLTRCPRTTEEIEHVMRKGKWPPTRDANPELKRTYLCEC